MNTFVPENATVKVYQTPDGKMIARTNVLNTLKVEVITVTDLAGAATESPELPFEVPVNDVFEKVPIEELLNS